MKLDQIRSPLEFVQFVATLRATGSGWIVVGSEAFSGESERILSVADLADKAKELLSKPYTVTESTMVKALIPDSEDAQDILAAIAEKKRTHET